MTLRSANRHIKSICKIAIVGMPGSGKSFLSELLIQEAKEILPPIIDSDSIVFSVFPFSQSLQKLDDFSLYESQVYRWIERIPYSHILISGGSSILRHPELFETYERIWIKPPLEKNFDQYQEKTRVGLSTINTFNDFKQLYYDREKFYQKAEHQVSSAHGAFELIKSLIRN